MKIKPLTSLRFFFALMVFLRHSDFIFNHEQFRNTHNPVFSQLYDSFFAEGNLYCDMEWDGLDQWGMPLAGACMCTR